MQAERISLSPSKVSSSSGLDTLKAPTLVPTSLWPFQTTPASALRRNSERFFSESIYSEFFLTPNGGPRARTRLGHRDDCSK